MSNDRYAKLIRRISEGIADYRKGEIAEPTPEHVECWVNQFDGEDQLAILRETSHLLRQVYVPKETVKGFIGNLAGNEDLVGESAEAFWRSVGFLRLQRQSRSQNDLLELLDEVLGEHFGLDTSREEGANGTYIYIDDAIFSGNQIRSDLVKWMTDNDIRNCTVHVIVIGYHKSGQWYANREIRKEAGPRSVRVHWWKAAALEDWRRFENVGSLNILWPTAIPDDPHVEEWLDNVPEDRRHFDLRPVMENGRNEFFASENSRNVIEQAFVKKGAYIRSLSQNPSALMRPLGYNKLHGPGFGTMFATYRNCPNNCPLVMWWGDADKGPPLNLWYPLFPRRTRRLDPATDFDIEDIEF